MAHFNCNLTEDEIHKLIVLEASDKLRIIEPLFILLCAEKLRFAYGKVNAKNRRIGAWEICRRCDKHFAIGRHERWDVGMRIERRLSNAFFISNQFETVNVSPWTIRRVSVRAASQKIVIILMQHRDEVTTIIFNLALLHAGLEGFRWHLPFGFLLQLQVDHRQPIDAISVCVKMTKKSFEILVRWSLNRVLYFIFITTSNKVQLLRSISLFDSLAPPTPPTPSKTDTTRTPPSRWCEHKCEKWNACACNFNQLRKQQRRRQIPNKFSTLCELFLFISSTSVRMLSRGNCNLKIWRKVILWRRLSLSPAS